MSITEIDSANSSDLVRMVHEREVDFAVVDSLAYTVTRHIYHKAKLAKISLDSQSISWFFPKDSDDSLIEAANKFLEDFRSTGKLIKLKRRLFSHSKRFSVANSETLEKKVTIIIIRCHIQQKWPHLLAAYNKASLKQQNQLDLVERQDMA
mgnify:CR=1 FL=1